MAAVLDGRVPRELHAGHAHLSGRRCGDRRGAGYFVAFFRIPAFIVTLAGMLVFKGLSLALLQGQSVGPVPDHVPTAEFGLHSRLAGRRDLRTTSLLLGILVSIAMIVAKLRERARKTQHASKKSHIFLCGEDDDLRRVDRRLQLPACFIPGGCPMC